MPIRICHLITGLDTGGAERSLVNLVTAMNRDEFENEVVTLLKPGPDGAGARAGWNCGDQYGNRPASTKPNGSAVVDLGICVGTSRPFFKHGYTTPIFSVLPPPFLQNPRICFGTYALSEIDQAGIPRSTRYLARLLAMLSKRPDAIIVNSQDGRRYHDRIGYRPKQWINIPNGVDLERFSPRQSERAMLRDRLGLSANSVVVGLVARYHPMKDVQTFLRAASLFQHDHENARFVLCGDGLGPDNAPLAELIRMLDLDRRFVLLGRRPDIELIYPALDALTLCSIYGEGFPNVLCEAMACDVPCVATDVGDSAEIIGDCGLIVPRQEPQALAGAWRTLLEKGSRLGGEGGRARVAARYSLQQMCAHYKSLYRSLAQKPPKPRHLN